MFHFCKRKTGITYSWGFSLIAYHPEYSFNKFYYSVFVVGSLSSFCVLIVIASYLRSSGSVAFKCVLDQSRISFVKTRCGHLESVRTHTKATPPPGTIPHPHAARQVGQKKVRILRKQDHVFAS